MKRRALLGTLATLAAAGCAGSPGQQSDPTASATASATTNGQPTTRPTSTTATSEGSTPSELLGLGDAASAVDCPVGEEGRAVCYPEHADAALSLTPDPETVELPAGETTLTLANDTDHDYHVNFYGWALSKRTPRGWFRIAPLATLTPLHTLPAGETHEWTLVVDNGEEPAGGIAAKADIDIAGLGGGEYAFTVEGCFPVGGGEDDPFPVAAGARFDLGGDPVELTPTGDLDTSRDGSTVTVASNREPSEDEPLSVLTVERVGEAGVPPGRQIHYRVTEQLLRPGVLLGEPNPLRNAIPFFEDGVDTVRYEAPSGSNPPFGVEDTRYVAYEDEVYEITSERAD